MNLRLDWCSHEAAKYAVEKWHYSRIMPVGKTVKVGVWEDGRFAGAVVFSCGSSGVGSLGKRYGLQSIEVAELSRVALTRHRTPVTRLVAIALKMLYRAQPGLRLIVSYADPERGHIGGIYQGGNWIFTGRSAPDTAYIDSAGRRWHSRSVSETGYKVHMGKKQPSPKPSTMRAVAVEPKYRYLYPLDKAMREQIAPLAQPYPKRAGADGGNPVQQGGGSSILTPALDRLTV
jgi:hypothetical protein